MRLRIGRVGRTAAATAAVKAVALAALVLARPVPGAAAESREQALLRIERIRVHMARNLAALPNYTCTQTIERSQRRARGRRFELVDTLRLEVALVNGRELFAWPGSGKFDDREISEMIGTGASGNGNFGLHARAIFLGVGARFEYLGEAELEDRRVFQYAYRVPLARSGYRLRVGKAEGLSAYAGRFEAEVDSLDVVSLDVVADEIPAQVPLKQATTRMRYRRMPIGAAEFLLPESSEIALTDLDGNESRNVVHLSGCKQYGTESVISFAEAPAGATEAQPAPAPPSPGTAAAAIPVTGASTARPAIGELPLGLVFETALETQLEFPGAAIGDLVEGRVMSDAKRKGAVMIPKGTPVRGRLLGFRPVPGTRVPTLVVSIALTELDLPGGRAGIHGVVERTTPAGLAGQRITADDKGMLFLVSGSRRVLAKGMRIWWRLEGPEPGAAH